MKRTERENRLEKIEKEIRELQQKCNGIHSLEKTIETVEKKLEELASSPQKKEPMTESVKKVEQALEGGSRQKKEAT
ncbi:hypothetical protein PENTCL1PPCAC_27246, partial [Pristionchus entomophagus]